MVILLYICKTKGLEASAEERVGNKTYVVFKENATWHQASEYCQGGDGLLLHNFLCVFYLYCHVLYWLRIR